ncbi:MAG TPA: type II toxin-antitoxin system VapC family toxin [bacterium]|nr:type II toxin-antitoxin system VapC family toxin [bacterium]
MPKILDSNIIINALKGKSKLGAYKGSYITPIVYAEVLYGILYIGRKVKEFDDFLNENEIETLPIGKETAQIFTKIKLELNKKGNPLADNDLLIAASGLEYDLEVVTGNKKHFSRIRGLKVTEK